MTGGHSDGANDGTWPPRANQFRGSATDLQRIRAWLFALSFLAHSSRAFQLGVSVGFSALSPLSLSLSLSFGSPIRQVWLTMSTSGQVSLDRISRFFAYRDRPSADRSKGTSSDMSRYSLLDNVDGRRSRRFQFEMKARYIDSLTQQIRFN